MELLSKEIGRINSLDIFWLIFGELERRKMTDYLQSTNVFKYCWTFLPLGSVLV